ncbi:hypothetical protein B0J13DRAFT_640074 [Dactylonectria estremocensis]|uniref:Flavodoxin-like domain-containing protein n=1 Tax=Dactylonectria estremocensis TaxID=1079267 RepID=A0A9P9EHE5_9HYPO|nr:hypothetical protein B0J13DRAFT_640074 [Dactylonectria estremocensis]
MQQSMMAVAMIINNFDLIKDESYKLKYHVTMTVRPKGFTMKARVRDGCRATELALKLHQMSSVETSAAPSHPLHLPLQSLALDAENFMTSAMGDQKGQVVIIHASNSGNCEALAHRLASSSAEQGVEVKAIDIANNAIDKLPRGVPVIFIVASYNGEPAGDAVDFVAWLKSLKNDELDGVKFAVFGCGHHDWAGTLFAVPQLIDMQLARCGAGRIVPLGTTETSNTDPFSDFEYWADEFLFPNIGAAEKFKWTPSIVAEVGDSRPELQISLGQPPRVAMRKNFIPAVVTEARCLSGQGVPEKRHLEIRLPEGLTYKAGDHLNILPRNSVHNITRALSLFGLGEDTVVTISSAKRNLGPGLPLDTPVTAADLFGAYVELGSIASHKTIQTLVDVVKDGDDNTRTALLSLVEDANSKTKIQDNQVSVLDLLERFPKAQPSLSFFLSMLVQMRPRAYSFSSAPEWTPGHATLTYTVVGTGLSATAPPCQGLASAYLSTLRPGSIIYVSLHPATPGFHLPESGSRPVIMVGAGTGLAPFRGFLQERRLL